MTLGDAERLTALIAETQKIQGLTTSDELTNAGDALVHLLTPLLAPKAGNVAEIEDELAELELPE